MSNEKPGRLVYRATQRNGTYSVNWDYNSAEKRAQYHGESDNYQLSTVRILPKKPKLHGFSWALKRLQEGKAVKRASCTAIYKRGYALGQSYLVDQGGARRALDWEHICALDWQLAEGT